MSQVAVRRPLSKLNLRDELRFKPSAIFHLFLDQSPHSSLLFGKIDKWARFDSQTLESSRDFTAHLRDKPIPYLGHVIKLVAFIVADDQRIKWIGRHIAANDKLLAVIHSVLHPCAASLP